VVDPQTTRLRTAADLVSDGMLLPPLCTQSDYAEFAKQAGFSTLAPSFDISKNVARTWQVTQGPLLSMLAFEFLADSVRISRDISLSLIQSPSLWALAFARGRDFLAFLKAFRAMKRGYANGTFRYAVMVFQKPDPSL
jgi:tocopherol O-methyltransferase